MINWKKAHVYKGFLLVAKRTETGYIPVLLDESGYNFQVSAILSRRFQTYSTHSEAVFCSRQAVDQIIIQRLQQRAA